MGPDSSNNPPWLKEASTRFEREEMHGFFDSFAPLENPFESLWEEEAEPTKSAA